MYKYILIIFVLLLPNTLFATNWANEFPLYIYGDVSFMATIYEFINSVVEDDAVEVIVGLGMTITAFIGGIKLKDGDMEGFGKNIIAPITLLALFFTPSVDVHITDIRVDKGYIDHTLSPDGGYQKVESVPYAIAFLPASAMLLVNITVDLIDNNWAAVHIANKFSSMGFQELSSAIRDTLKTEGFIVDANTSKYAYDLNIYIKECIVGTALTYNNNTHYANAPTQPFPENLNPANFPTNFGDDYIDYEDYTNISHTNIKCSTAYADLVVSNKDKVLDACEAKIKILHPTKDLTSASASEAFRQQIGDSANIVGTLKKAVATTVTSQFFQKQKSLDAVGIDGYSVATELSIQTTLANMRSEGPAKFEWMAKTLPDAILIISGIFIAAFPLLIIVQSFMGANAFTAIANYFMGFFAFYFNFVGLALVQNVISFFTAQEAQQTIAMSMNMPFSAQHLPTFLMQQADMAGMAGMIGAASIVAVTPLIFYGESKGFAAAMGAVTGAFKGGIDANSSDTLKQSALETQIDQELLEEQSGMSEQEASAWLSEGQFNKRPNMTSLDTYNQIQRGYNQIGSGLTAKDLVHSGNVGDYVEGSYLASTQQTMKTVGMGASIGSVQNAGEVAMQDGMVMAESINATDRMRNVDESTHERNLGQNYDTEAIGTGMAAQQFAKDKGMEYTGTKVLEGFDSNDALFQAKQDKLDNLLSQQSQAGMQTSKEDYIEHGKMARHEANNIADKINNISDEVDRINAQKQDTGLSDVEEFRLDQIQDEWKSLNNDWNTANTQVTSDFNAYEIAKPQSQIDNEVSSFDNAISQAKSEVDNFNGGELNGAVSSLIASSVNQSVAQLASGEGLIGSMGFKEDGSFNSEGSQGKILETGYYNQSRINANKTMGMGKEDINSDQMLSIQANAHSGMLSEFTEGKILRNSFGDDLHNKGSYALSKNGNKEEISFSDMIENETSNKLAGRMGSAKAFDDIGFDTAASNAQFGATSQALSTAAKIATQGGVDKAVATDVAEASMKAAMQQGATQGQIEELAKKSGMNDEAAKLFSKEIVSGSQEASELIKKGITDAGKDLSSSMSASKTGSDIRAIDTAGGHDSFVQLGKDQASLKTAQSLTGASAAKSAEFLTKDGMTSEGMDAYGIQAGESASILGVKRDVFFGKNSKDNISKLRKGMKDKGIEAHIANGKTKDEAESIMESAFNSAGLTEDAQGQDAINALAKMGAMNYASSKTLSAGGVQFNLGVGADGNFRIGEATAQESVKGGNQLDTGANFKSAQQAFVASGGDANDTQGFINYVKNSQLTDAHKKNIFGHVSAGVANAMDMEQHDAEQLVATGGAALGAIGLNSLVGNPIGKIWNSTKSNSSKNSMPNNSSNISNGVNSNNTLNNSVDNGKTSNMNHNVSPSDEIKYSRENLSNYSKEYSQTQQKRVDLEESFNADDRGGKMNRKQRASRLSEINNLKANESKLSYNMQGEANNISKNKAYIQYQDNLLKGDVAKSTIGSNINQGTSNQLHEINGRPIVDGIDTRGNEKSFRADNTNSRNSYLRNNAGASSMLPTQATSTMSKALSVGGNVLQKAGVAGAVDQAGGIGFNMFSAIGQVGSNWYKNKELDFSPIGKAFTSIPATVATGALDLANVAGSSVNAAYHSTFGTPTFGEAFNTSFDNSARTYTGISQYASNGMVSQMSGSSTYQTNHSESIADTGSDSMQYAADTARSLEDLSEVMVDIAQNKKGDR